MSLEGIDKVMDNIHKELKKIENRSVEGFIEAGIVIRREMDTTPPVVPLDTGNLRASYFMTVNTNPKVINSAPAFKGTPQEIGDAIASHAATTSAASTVANLQPQPVMIFGFTANYAHFVHEMMQSVKGKKIKWNRPGSGPKFFEQALTRNRDRIIEIIQKHIQIR